jgi:hypothetical protein
VEGCELSADGVALGEELPVALLQGGHHLPCPVLVVSRQRREAVGRLVARSGADRSLQLVEDELPRPRGLLG